MVNSEIKQKGIKSIGNCSPFDCLHLSLTPMSRLVPVFDRIRPCDQSEYSCGNEDQRVKNYTHTHTHTLES